MEVIKTTNNRGLDEEIERILARLKVLEKSVKPVKTADTTTSAAVEPLPPILSIIGATTVQPVQATGVVGILSSYAPEDHAHAGVHSVKVIGQPQLTGDAVYQAGTGMTLGQAGNTITFNAIFGTIPPTLTNFAGSPYSVGGGDFVIFADTTAGAVTVQFAGIGANTGRLVVLVNTGSGANAINVTCSPNSIVGINSIVNTTGRRAVWYICDGTNWYSFTNSIGN